MKRDNKILLVGGCIVLVFGLVGLVWWLYKEGVFVRLFAKERGGYGSNVYEGGTIVSAADTFPLRKGSRGNNVKRLQSALNGAIAFLMPARPFLYNGKQRTSIAVDGVWGDETQAAVNWYYMLNKVEITEVELSRIKGV